MTQKRIAFLKEFLKFIGIHPDRLHLQWVSSAEAPQFAQAATAFIARVRELGPSSLGPRRTENLPDRAFRGVENG
jgi:F420-non-reducing hydrogenase iron-sulfur subunit